VNGMSTGPVGAPAIDARARVVPAVLRIALGLLWMENSFWKVPPDFGMRQGKLLYGFVNDAVKYPVFAPYTAFVKHVVLPHFTIFGWGVLLTESTLAALLILGLATRLVGLGGAIYALTIALATLNAPHEWTWSYYMLILCHLVVAATAAGRTFGLDGLFRPVWLASDAKVSRLLSRVS